MDSPLISILIPFKNTEQFIEECIQSIIMQKYTHWEAIFISDASSDTSYNIVKKYTKIDVRIKVKNNLGVGIIAALRTAFKLSKGLYITRMDSDDIMTTNRISHMLKSLQVHGKKHVATGQVKYFRTGGISNGYLKYENWINRLIAKGNNYTEIYKECVIPSPCWMLHRHDFLYCGGFTPNRYPEDYDLTFRFYEAGFRCIPCNKILLLWRDYSTRTSRTHEHYAQNYFLGIKMHYFLKLDYDKQRPITVWGAGSKGKTIAKILLKHNVPFYWTCNNPNKIGKSIYNQTLLNFKYLKELNQPQSIVTVANENAQKQIRTYFIEQKMKPMIDFFFFC